MEKELEDAVYSDEENLVSKIVYKHPSLLPLALRYAVRYDRPLILSMLLPLGGNKEEITEDIIGDAIAVDDTHLINSMIYNDVLNLYVLLRLAARMKRLQYYNMAIGKLKDLGLEIDSNMWMGMAISTNSTILSLILEDHSGEMDLNSLAKSIIGERSISKLYTILRYHRQLDIMSLIIYSMESGFDDGTHDILRYVGEDVDPIVEMAVSRGNLEVLDSLLSLYKGDMSNLTIIAVENGHMDIYRSLIEKVDSDKYTLVAVALARTGNLDDMIDLIPDIRDPTSIIEELIRAGYSDLIGDILDFSPDIVEYIPIMYTAYREGVYPVVRGILFDYKEYVTPQAEAFDIILRLGKESLPQIRRMRVDLSPLRSYVRELGFYDIDRHLAYANI